MRAGEVVGAALGGLLGSEFGGDKDVWSRFQALDKHVKREQ